MHRGSIHQRHPKAPFTLMPCGINCYAVLAPVSKCYPPLMGRLPTCYSPVRHSSFQLSASTREERSVRLACIRHAASVRPEPGSNSHENTFHKLLKAHLITDLLFFSLEKRNCCFFTFVKSLHIWFVFFV